MNLTTRQATKADHDFLWDVKIAAEKQYVQRVFGWDEKVQRDYFERDFNPASTQIIQADGKDAGMLKVVERAAHLVLSHIELLPEFQMRGIGAQMIQRLIARAEASRKPIKLRVMKVNPSKRLYERLGFQGVGETETHYLMEWRPPA